MQPQYSDQWEWVRPAYADERPGGRSDGAGSSEYSPVSGAEQEPQGVTGSSEYSPVSDAEPEPQEVKTEAQAEVLHMARFTQARAHRSSVDDVVDSVFWTVLVSSKSDFGEGGESNDQGAPATKRYSAIGTARSGVVKGPTRNTTTSTNRRCTCKMYIS
jgi:hypothetical protein